MKERTHSRFTFAINDDINEYKQEEPSKSILVIGCGHKKREISNCQSDHNREITIDIDEAVEPDFIMDISNPVIDEGIKQYLPFKKIIFEGYSPSFWELNVLEFLSYILAKGGGVYLVANTNSSAILRSIKENSDEFVHKYSKIFNYDSLTRRINSINEELPSTNKNIKTCIETQNLLGLRYLVEKLHKKVTLDESFQILQTGSLQLVQYLINETTIIASLCSPNDECEGYYDFFEALSNNELENVRTEITKIPQIHELLFANHFFDYSYENDFVVNENYYEYTQLSGLSEE